MAADKAERRVKTFCNVLAYTGCRISEALELCPRRVDLAEQSLRLRSLKKRKDKEGQPRVIFRSVPVPPMLIEQLDLVYGIREIQRRGDDEQLDARIWSWTRGWGWVVVKEVMTAAEIPEGPHKTAKGLRHGYGIAAMQALTFPAKSLGPVTAKISALLGQNF